MNGSGSIPTYKKLVLGAGAMRYINYIKPNCDHSHL